MALPVRKDRPPRKYSWTTLNFTRPRPRAECSEWLMPAQLESTPRRISLRRPRCRAWACQQRSELANQNVYTKGTSLCIRNTSGNPLRSVRLPASQSWCEYAPILRAAQKACRYNQTTSRSLRTIPEPTPFVLVAYGFMPTQDNLHASAMELVA